MLRMHFSPRFICSSSSCNGKFREAGYSIARVWNLSTAPTVTGGDGAWHARVAQGTVLFQNLNGTDPDGVRLDPKVSASRVVTISSENLASTMCRALRAWKGLQSCTL